MGRLRTGLRENRHQPLVRRRLLRVTVSLRALITSNLVPVCRLDIGWILDCAPWQLGKRPTVVVVALGLHLEAAFLRHGSVPPRAEALEFLCQWESQPSHVVRHDQRGEQCHGPRRRKPVLLWFMGRHINDRVNIGLPRFGIRTAMETTRYDRLTNGTPAKFQKITMKPHFS